MTTIAKRIPDAILTRAAKVAGLDEDAARCIVDDEVLTFSEYARSMDEAMREQSAQRRIDVLAAMLGAWVRSNPIKATCTCQINNTCPVHRRDVASFPVRSFNLGSMLGEAGVNHQVRKLGGIMPSSWPDPA